MSGFARDFKWEDVPVKQSFLETMSFTWVYPDYPTEDCVYCGQVATDKDHLLPRNWTGESMRKKVPVVPSCAECNRVFLNDVYEPDVQNRRIICHQKMRLKYARALSTILYADRDLKQFGSQLRTVIVKQMEKHVAVKERLSWPPTADFDHKAWKHAWEEKGTLNFEDSPRQLSHLFYDRTIQIEETD